MLGTLDGGILRLVALAKVFQIAVDDHDGIIDNHAEHHNQSCQRNDVQLNTRHVHDSHADKRAQRDGDGSNDSRTQREEHHHHQDDDSHRNEQVTQEGGDTRRYHLGLVCNTRYCDIVGQHVAAEFVENLVHLLTIDHYIVARYHLCRQQQTRMSILFDATLIRIIFAHYASHITDSCHLATDRVAENNLIGNLLHTVFSRLHMDGHLLVAIINSAAHRGQPLSLQASEEYLLTDAISLQALAVNVK